MRKFVAVGVVLGWCGAAFAADEGWTPMFNGKDLSGWVNINCAPETWGIKDGVVTCTGKPTGAMRMNRMVENFVLEIEWRHLQPGGNSGIFVWGGPIAAPGVPYLRGIEVQVLDNAFNVKGKNEWYTTHGDIFPIHGASMKPIYKGNGDRCFPIEERSKSTPEWNHYRVEGIDGKIRLHVNGKLVSGGDDCNYRKGYLALESEGAPVEFRNGRIKELPGGHATAANTAPADQGWHSLYNGLDLRGWKADDKLKSPWKPRDWQLNCAADAGTLWCENEFGDCEFVVDCHVKGTSTTPPAVVFADNVRVPLVAKAGGWVRNVVTVRGGEVTVKAGNVPATTTKLPNDAAKRAVGLAGPAGSAASFGNIFVRELTK